MANLTSIIKLFDMKLMQLVVIDNCILNSPGPVLVFLVEYGYNLLI